MTREYKAEKEASVTDLGGGGIWEINFITLTAPVAAFLWAVLQSRQSFFKPYTIPAYITDFLLQCCSILFATTTYSSSPQSLIGLLLLPALASFLQPRPASVKPAKPVKVDDEPKPKSSLPIRPFITAYRGAMMIITCISILAVDFKVFPRRFAKTESFGTSLMDMGVGSFVFASGIVAARQQLREQSSGTSKGFVARMRSALRHSIPLAVLGLVRLGMVKGLDYAEHVSEYGVHWNFFFTLALLSPVMAVLDPILRWVPSYGILAFVIAIGYELWLFMTPLKAYIILSDRIEGDWLSQNREGVYSFIGYLAIFIAGIGAGQGILPRDIDSNNPFQLPKIPEKKAVKKNDFDEIDEDDAWLASVLGGDAPPEASPEVQERARKRAQEIMAIEPPQLRPDWPKTAFFHLVKWTGLWFVFSVWAMWHYGPRLFVSRRMANLAYVCWVCCFNSAQLLLFSGTEAIMFPNLYEGRDDEDERERAKDATSKVLNAFNRNGLALFLLANLLTGAINLVLETWHLDDLPAMAVLIAYIAAIAAVGMLLDRYNISIKL
ncbi:hypothetical protein AMS68_003002 [Peltaster fructicola]|uniref:GPI-anchored wall transfer protein n=1 Tax=Peltaster fructicola TaxID=286661 RepID=A0A6H0XS74_9PEZI|nr:hypothetical protein AMS68_003002 [Peltaster fructicola]